MFLKNEIFSIPILLSDISYANFNYMIKYISKNMVFNTNFSQRKILYLCTKNYKIIYTNMYPNKYIVSYILHE